MSKVPYVVEFTINDGTLEEFKAMSAGIIEAVKGNEPGTLGYQWYLAEGGKRCLGTRGVYRLRGADGPP